MLGDAVVIGAMVVLCAYFGAIVWRVWASWRARRTAERVCDGPARQRQAVAAAWEYAYVRMRLHSADATAFASWYGDGLAATREDATTELMIAAAFIVWSRHQAAS